METQTNKALGQLRVDLVRLIPEEILDVLIWDLMGQFGNLREKEYSLEEVLTLGMQGKKEVTAVIEKMRHTEEDGHAIMSQRWHNEAKNACITVNLIR